jgi:hypothetical protein
MHPFENALQAPVLAVRREESPIDPMLLAGEDSSLVPDV